MGATEDLRALNKAFHKALLDDNTWEAQQVWNNYAQATSKPSVHDDIISAAGKIARAYDVLGIAPHSPWLPVIPKISPDALQKYLFPRAIGVTAERQYWTQSPTSDINIFSSPCISLEQFISRCRYIVRVPERFQGLDGGDKSLHFIIALEMQPHALQDFVDRFRKSDVWQGMGAVKGGESLARFGLSATIGAKIGNNFVSLRAISFFQSMSTDTLSDLAAGDIIKIDSYIFPRPRDMYPERIGPVPHFQSYSHMLNESHFAVKKDLNAFLGTEKCLHINSEWVPNTELVRKYVRGAKNFDALLLRCGDCYYERIACVPRHRLPANHEHALTDAPEAERDAYLAREKYYYALRGLPYKDITSLEVLQNRDGVADLNPASYAIGITQGPVRITSAAAFKTRRGF